MRNGHQWTTDGHTDKWHTQLLQSGVMLGKMFGECLDEMPSVLSMGKMFGRECAEENVQEKLSGAEGS